MKEKVESLNWLDSFNADTTPTRNDFGYVPLPTNMEGEPEGSVYAAHLRQENTIGSMLNRHTTYQLNEETRKNYDFTNYANKIPRDLIEYSAQFYGATSDDEFNTIETQIRAELKYKSLLAAHPWKALAYSLIDPLEPANWLPGSVIYKEAKAGAAVARSMMGASLSAIASTGSSEIILNANQHTRTMQESVFNTVGAGILGGIVGGGLSYFGSRKLAGKAGDETFDPEQYKRLMHFKTDINEAVNPSENLSAAKNAIMDDGEIARMPKYIQTVMKFTPMNRLLTSPFKTARWAGSSIFEHNYELVKNSDGYTSGVSIERSIKMEMRQLNLINIEHMNHYYAMHGVSNGVFKATRKAIGDAQTQSPTNLNLDQFNQAVYETALTGQDHVIPQVNSSAKMWRQYFDKRRDQAIALDLLPEDVNIPNAPNYIMVMYNKNKIIEEGGKAARGQGTFSQHLYDQFEASNETTKQYLSSPMYTEAQGQITTLSERMKRSAPDELAQINGKVTELNKKINALERLKSKRPNEELTKISDRIKVLQEQKTSVSKDITERQASYVEQIKAEIKSHAKGVVDYKNSIKSNRSKVNTIQNKIADQAVKVGEIKGRIKAIKGESPKKDALNSNLIKANDVWVELRKQEQTLNGLIKEDEGHIKTHDKRTVELADIAKHPERSVPELRAKLKEIEAEIAKTTESKKTSPNEIRAHEKAIRELEKEKKAVERSREIPAEDKKKFADEIEALEKSILDNAPPSAKTWEGKLHNVIEGDDIEDTQNLIWSQVEQTIDNILGDSDGKLLNPFLSKLGGNTRPFKARKLIIDQLQASPWHITDIQKIAEAHNRAMVPAIKLQEVARQNGYKEINDFVTGIGESLRKEFDAESRMATGKKAQKLRTQYDADLRDLKAGIEMLQGVYGQGFNVLNSTGAQFFDNIMSWNYTRMLGYMTISSLPELAISVMRNGVMRTLAHGIGESFSTVKSISKKDIRSLGYAIETEMASQFKSYIEHEGLSTNPSPFTKGLQSLTRNFGNLSLMNPWTDMVQNFAGHIAISGILDVIHKVVSGKGAAKKETANLARLGIAPEHYAEIAKFTEGNVYKGTRYADWTNWDVKTAPEAYALKAFQAAVAKSIEDIAVMPHFGDKPLTLQQKGAFGNMSKLLFQFKSYLMAVTNRVLFSGIQNRYDMNVYTGLASMIAMGMLGYIITSYLHGEEPDLSPEKLLREGLDRSAALGVIGEGINIAQKLFQLGEGVSRYKSRNAFGSVLGATGGSASDLVDLFNKVNPLSSAKGSWTTKDADAIMKLMPLQNLFYIQKINKNIERNIAVELGATPVND